MFSDAASAQTSRCGAGTASRCGTGADRRLLNVDAPEEGRCRGIPCSRLSFHDPFLLLMSAIKLEAGGDS